MNKEDKVCAAHRNDPHWYVWEQNCVEYEMLIAIESCAAMDETVRALQ